MGHHLFTWWRHQMETFSALQAICAGYSPVPGEFLPQRPVTRSFDVFFDLRLNERLSKRAWGWWFETLSRPLWRHCDEVTTYRPFSARPLYEVKLNWCQLDIKQQFWWNLNQNENVIFKKMNSKCVICKMSAIVTQFKCVTCWIA